MVIKALMILAYFAVLLSVGFYFRKKVASTTDFVLGGRKVGMWLSAFSYGTTYFSAVVFVGYAGQFGWRFGTAAVWIGIANAFIGSMIPWFLLGRRTRIMTNHLNSKTMPEFFGSRYSSSALKIGASLIAFVFLIPYTASLFNGLSRLFSMAFGIDFVYCIIAMAVLTAIFVVAGGYFASSFNDFIQGLIMLVGIVAVVGLVLHNNGGFIEAIRGMANVVGTEKDGVLGTAPGVFASFLGPDPISLLGVVLLTSLGTWGLPQMIGRFYAIKNEQMISKGAIISTVFAIFIAGGSYFLGSFGRLYGGEVARTANGAVIFDSIIPTMLSVFPAAMIGLVMLLVLSASISTLSALVMASASTLTLDFLKGNIIKKMNDKTQLVIIRVFIVVFIVISSAIAISNYNASLKGTVTFIAQLMGISWGALAGSFLAPFLYGLYWKRVTKIAVWCNFIFSAGLMTLNIFFRSTFPAIIQSPINAGAFAMLAGLIIVPVVSILTKKPDANAVDNCFLCYEQTVNVKVRDDLGA